MTIHNLELSDSDQVIMFGSNKLLTIKCFEWNYVVLLLIKNLYHNLHLLNSIVLINRQFKYNVCFLQQMSSYDVIQIKMANHNIWNFFLKLERLTNRDHSTEICILDLKFTQWFIYTYSLKFLIVVLGLKSLNLSRWEI